MVSSCTMYFRWVLVIRITAKVKGCAQLLLNMFATLCGQSREYPHSEVHLYHKSDSK